MRLIESLKKKKFVLFNIFLTLYIGTNLIGGERGLVSYFDKKKFFEELLNKEIKLSAELEELERKISLLKNNFTLQKKQRNFDDTQSTIDHGLEN